jgi:hypothetical protein
VAFFLLNQPAGVTKGWRTTVPLQSGIYIVAPLVRLSFVNGGWTDIEVSKSHVFPLYLLYPDGST